MFIVYKSIRLSVRLSIQYGFTNLKKRRKYSEKHNWCERFLSPFECSFFLLACSALKQVPPTMTLSDPALCSSLQLLVTYLLVLLLH